MGLVFNLPGHVMVFPGAGRIVSGSMMIAESGVISPAYIRKHVLISCILVGESCYERGNISETMIIPTIHGS